jgi:hypothetical protein
MARPAFDQENPMRDYLKFYINGEWVDPVTPRTLDVQNPATEESYARISIGSKADVDKAVAAARRAFETFSQTTKEQRLALLQKIVEVYQRRYGEFVETISLEMGAPLGLSKAAQAATGIAQSSCTACRLSSVAPLRTAWRMRSANSGWSLRRKDPTTSTRSSSPSALIGMPSQGAPARVGSAAKSL